MPLDMRDVTLLRNMILSREFTFHKRENFLVDPISVVWEGKSFQTYRTSHTLTAGQALDYVNVRELALSQTNIRSLYVIHNRRAIMQDRLHASVLSLTVNSIVVATQERIVRLESPRSRRTHAYAFSIPTDRNSGIDCVLREAQSSKGFLDRGVSLVKLPDGFLAFTIDGWLADYSDLESVNPIDCIDYTREMVRRAGGTYRRNHYGMYIGTE